MKNEELSPEQMQQILHETESESDLTGSEEEKELPKPVNQFLVC